MKTLIHFSLCLMSLLVFQTAWAVPPPCSTAVIGQQRYSTTSNIMQICDGISWNTIDGGALTACTVTDNGKQRFSGGVLQYCNGTNWRSMNMCPTTTSTCSQGGRIRLTFQARSIYCDGAHWAIIAGGCASQLNCDEHVDSASCTADASCAWISGACQPGGCAGYSFSGPCNADPNCYWNGSVCNDAI